MDAAAHRAHPGAAGDSEGVADGDDMSNWSPQRTMEEVRGGLRSVPNLRTLRGRQRQGQTCGELLVDL